MSNALRNTLTIAETKDILCAEHAARLFVAECWWAIVPNKEGNFAHDGNAQPFKALDQLMEKFQKDISFEDYALWVQVNLGNDYSQFIQLLKETNTDESIIEESLQQIATRCRAVSFCILLFLRSLRSLRAVCSLATHAPVCGRVALTGLPSAPFNPLHSGAYLDTTTKSCMISLPPSRVVQHPSLPSVATALRCSAKTICSL